MEPTYEDGTRYALNAFVDTTWFDVIDLTDNAEHVRLGLALRWIELNSVGANERDRYHFHEWNNLMNNTINTFTMFLMQYAVNTHHRSIKSLLAAPCSVMMHGVIKLTLERLFDARNPDALSYERIDILLNDHRRDSLWFSMSHACFSVGSAITRFTNACWGIGTVYDTHLCHYFRTVLFLLLAIVKHITGVQNYCVHRNLELTTTGTLTIVEFRVVEFDFTIRRLETREDSSDDDVKEEVEEEEEEEEEEDEVVHYNHDGDDDVYTITHNADGTITTYFPPQFTLITSYVAEGMVLAERDHIELLVEILIQRLDQDQLGRTAQRVSQQIREVTGQQHNVQPAVTEPSRFFNPTDSFSSCSEGEDEM